MTCDVSRSILHGYVDGELDALRAAEFEQHMEGCSACVRDLEAQETLRSAIQRAQLYEPLPAGFENKIRRELDESSSRVSSPRFHVWPLLAAAAVLLLVVSVSWKFSQRNRPGAELSVTAADSAAVELVDAHIRALQPGHLTDVTSTDQHTVKPWFAGKIAFAPPVSDFAAQDFPLLGGRLDVFQGRTVAALVYGRRKHFISVFIWPDPAMDAEQYAGAMNGYHWLSWKQNGLRFCEVADTNGDDLVALKDLIAR
jgi:anti-sigma factor RsiW